MKRVVIILAIVAGCQCGPIYIPQPDPSPVSDAGTITTTATLIQATCVTACARLAVLDCPAARPTTNGTTCAMVCENVEHSGLATWGVGCVSAAVSCEAADKCGGPL